jgi:hypothetical protein
VGTRPAELKQAAGGAIPAHAGEERRHHPVTMSALATLRKIVNTRLVAVDRSLVPETSSSSSSLTALMPRCRRPGEINMPGLDLLAMDRIDHLGLAELAQSL